ncbi:hypothetical protein BSLG_010098 [Batrachochytrium salamandrivorans]|nr:hypothetical protein BSLG_010098 [Batrachochytrium salamandrivorans]
MAAALKFFPAADDAQISCQSLAGTTLLMPGPNGLGFVGQLTLDLVISTLKMQRVGFLESPDAMAVVGMDSYGSWDTPKARVAIEVYQSSASEPSSESGKNSIVTVLMLRSRVHKGRGVAFCNSLTEWIQSIEFSKVLLVTALDGTRRTDRQIMSSPLRYCTVGKDFHDQFPTITKLDWLLMEPSEELYTENPTRIPPGGGLTRFMLDAFERNKMSLTVMSWFALEGGSDLFSP